jgi:hypothetical protein
LGTWNIDMNIGEQVVVKADLLSRPQVVILIIIPFRRIIGSPTYSGLHLSSGGQTGWPEIPQEPIILGSKKSKP